MIFPDDYRFLDHYENCRNNPFDFEPRYELAIYCIKKKYQWHYIDELIDSLARCVSDDLEEYLFTQLKEKYHSDYKAR